ncbi:MAG: tRNA (adenosine(37)-N6)-dimethylallyltransferase MiaA [Pseudomonadota bacterium]
MTMTMTMNRSQDSRTDIPIVAIVGPTASGKTDLAIALALKADAEIVSVDSQQVYQGMDIGTGKATLEQQSQVPHHLLDVAPPDEPMTAARFVELADQAIVDIASRRRSVVLAGGSGLYYRALVYGLFAGPGADPHLRDGLEAEARVIGVESLWERLRAVDPWAAAKIDRHDLVRTIRALEVYLLTGRPISEHQVSHDYRKAPPRYQVLSVGLDPPRDELTRRIDARVETMVKEGLVDEVRALLARGFSPSLRAMAAIGYREICAHVGGQLGLAEAIERIKRATRKYARRQLAWFRSEPAVTWYKGATVVDTSSLADWLAAGGRGQERGVLHERLRDHHLLLSGATATATPEPGGQE